MIDGFEEFKHGVTWSFTRSSSWSCTEFYTVVHGVYVLLKTVSLCVQLSDNLWLKTS
jgi:hypothetical protein